MSEAEQSINNVSQSISNLSQTLAENDKRFKLSSSRIVQWSQSTGKAGKRWTTFSRITSGTGLWKFQNYMRGTLEIIGAFGERTDEAIKAQTEQEKALAQSIKGIRKIGEEYTELAKVHKQYTDRIEKAEEKANTSLVNRIKETEEISERKTEDLKMRLKAAKEADKIDSQQNAEAVKRAKRELKAMQMKQARLHKNRKVTQKEHDDFIKKEDAKKAALEEAEMIQKNFSKNNAKHQAELKTQMEEEMKSRDEYIQQLKEQFKGIDITRIKIADYTDSQLEALESTNAFNQAIIRGKSEQEAYAAAFEQVTENVEKNKNSYDSFKSKLQEAIKIQEIFNKGAGSPEFEQLKEDEKKKRKKIRKEELGIPDAAGDDGIIAGVNKFFKPAIKAFNAVKKQEERQKLFLKIQMKGLAFQQFMRPILNMAFKFLIFGILGMIALLAVAKIAYDIVDIMGQFGVLDDIKEIIGSVLLIGGAIFGAVGAFFSGDFTAMFDYLSIIMASFLEIGWNLFTIFVNGVFAVAVGLFYSIFDLVGWLVSDGNLKKAGLLLLKIGGMLLVIYFVKYLMTQALLLIGIYALPIMITVLIAALFTALLMQLYTRMDRVIKPVKNTLNFIKDALTDDPDKGFWDENKHVLGLAKGGITTGAMNLVGEQGPELVKLPAGSRVYSNSQSKSMTGGSTVINNHITINAKDTSDAELRRIAEKIGNMVNNKMNRSTSSRTMG